MISHSTVESGSHIYSGPSLGFVKKKNGPLVQRVCVTEIKPSEYGSGTLGKGTWTCRTLRWLATNMVWRASDFHRKEPCWRHRL